MADQFNISFRIVVQNFPKVFRDNLMNQIKILLDYHYHIIYLVVLQWFSMEQNPMVENITRTLNVFQHPSSKYL